jgi:methylated-DNA-[protein]-cysteine S-methyltransferase
MVLETPIGPLTPVAAPDGGLAALRFGATRAQAAPVCERVGRQLEAYFAGELEAFDVELSPQSGSAFEQTVWEALARIPYGTTTTYGELAAQIGHAGKARAVGWANSRNPIPVIVPCHRVIGAKGKLTGYAGGLAVKEQLLRLEGALLL